MAEHLVNFEHERLRVKFVAAIPSFCYYVSLSHGQLIADGELIMTLLSKQFSSLVFSDPKSQRIN